ncbi:MAG: NADH-quinone oxidoreductase subunit NuoE [Clostridia bacterium]|nr:NADH-quinone oxidoreductase subunit NuoE [Clostridia bacterium]
MEVNGTVVRPLDLLDEIVHRHNTEEGAAIPILQEVQNTFGFVAPAVLERIADLAHMSATELYSIVTFYAQFRLQPPGENLVRVCTGTACHLAGAEKILQAVENETGAREGGTSPDGKFTMERVACLGCCSLAPVVMLNEQIHGRLTPEAVRRLIKAVGRR